MDHVIVDYDLHCKNADSNDVYLCAMYDRISSAQDTFILTYSCNGAAVCKYCGDQFDMCGCNGMPVLVPEAVLAELIDCEDLLVSIDGKHDIYGTLA